MLNLRNGDSSLLDSMMGHLEALERSVIKRTQSSLGSSRGRRKKSKF